MLSTDQKWLRVERSPAGLSPQTWKLSTRTKFKFKLKNTLGDLVFMRMRQQDVGQW